MFQSVSDDSIDFGNATRSSILDTLGDAEKKQIKKKDSKPWWNIDDHDDDDSSGKGILATGRSFLKSQRSSQTIEEVDEEEQRETSPGQPSDNVAVSISRDSLEPEGKESLNRATGFK
ncbi:UNVERIFIED_CONTAM: hypothetical protein FKN15_039605 [Acipenser sinensis]